MITGTRWIVSHGYNGRLPEYVNLVEALERAPGDQPFVTAWIDEEEQDTATFAEFRRLARGQSAALEEHGVGIGDRVVIIMPQGILAMTTFVGAMMLGAVPAFLAYPNFKIEPAKYRAGLAGVTANLGARLVVIDDEFPDELLGHISLGDAATLLRMNRARGGDVRRRRDQLRSKTQQVRHHAAKIPADSLAFIQHSAGTTGLQKGVALTHAAVLRQLEHLRRVAGVDRAKDRIYSWLPLYHDMGLIACFMLPMVCHVPVVMQSPLDWVMQPEAMLQIISEHKCTLAWLPNFAFQFVPRRVPRERWAKYDLSSLRALINCSEPVRSSSMLEFQRAFEASGLRAGTLQASYAMAENVFAVTQTQVGRSTGPMTLWVDAQQFRSRHRVVVVPDETPGAVCFTSSGQLLPDHQIRIADDSGTVLGRSSVGEILVKSDCLFEGYYNRADLTASAIIDGWYRTGDLGFLWDGELYVVGREKDLLIIGGENIYPQDIEEVVAGHRAIHDGRVVAMGVYNPDLGTEDIVVVAEVESGELVRDAVEIEREVRTQVVGALGIAIRTLFLKPPKWIVKSTAGKPARSSTREKLLAEHPELKNG